MSVLIGILVLLLILTIVYLVGREILSALSAPPIFQTILYLVVLLVALLVILGQFTGLGEGFHFGSLCGR